MYTYFITLAGNERFWCRIVTDLLTALCMALVGIYIIAIFIVRLENKFPTALACIYNVFWHNLIWECMTVCLPITQRRHITVFCYFSPSIIIIKTSEKGMEIEFMYQIDKQVNNHAFIIINLFWFEDIHSLIVSISKL